MQKSFSIPLTFLFLVGATTAIPQPQAPTPSRLEFEVASIKPSKPGKSPGGGLKAMPGGQSYVATNVSVRLMIQLVFHLTPQQVTGGPDWLNTDLYDVEAKADAPHSLEELHIMFQNLLIDRFKLQFHKETKILPAYELVVGKSGLRMKENANPQNFDIPVSFTGFGKLSAVRCSMPYFAWTLSRFMDRPVLDHTGLTQFYDFKLEWTPELPPNLNGREIDPATLPPTNGPDIFAAVRQQLGLKLDSHKGPVDVMVLDHIEKPSQN